MRRAHSHGLISSGGSIGKGVAKSKNCGVRILWCITKKYKKRRYKMFVWVRRCRTLKACLRCRLAETVLVLLLRGCCFCRGRLHSLASPYNGYGRREEWKKIQGKKKARWWTKKSQHLQPLPDSASTLFSIAIGSFEHGRALILFAHCSASLEQGAYCKCSIVLRTHNDV